MPKRTKSRDEVATAAANQQKTAKPQQQATTCQPKDPTQLAREWTLKIKGYKDVNGHLQKLSFRISIKYNAKSLQRIFHLAFQN
jgi:hypothetical protein